MVAKDAALLKRHKRQVLEISRLFLLVEALDIDRVHLSLVLNVVDCKRISRGSNPRQSRNLFLDLLLLLPGHLSHYEYIDSALLLGR